MGEYEDWLAGLKVGDKVVVVNERGLLYGNKYTFSTVTKITPSRLISIEGEVNKFKSGYEMGKSYYHDRIIPPSSEVDDKMFRERAIRKMESLNIEKLTNDQLREIIKIIDSKT